jgi:ribosome-associated heat shock protein Hsp15
LPRAQSATTAANRQRIDKWLWHARMVRTRSAAAALTEAGFVRLNGVRVTAPGHAVRVGDVVTLALDRAVRLLRVEGFCERRGQADAARALYSEVDRSAGNAGRPGAPAPAKWPAKGDIGGS